MWAQIPTTSFPACTSKGISHLDETIHILMYVLWLHSRTLICLHFPACSTWRSPKAHWHCPARDPARILSHARMPRPNPGDTIRLARRSLQVRVKRHMLKTHRRTEFKTSSENKSVILTDLTNIPREEKKALVEKKSERLLQGSWTINSREK